MNAADLVKPHRLSRTEYHRMADAGLFDDAGRIELIEGEIFDMAPIGTEHGSRTARLNNVLIRALGERAIVVEQHAIRLGEYSEPESDVVVVKPSWNFDPSAHPGAEDIELIIEVAQSSLRHDRDRKIPLYARHGIPEVWLVDLAGRELTVFREPLGDRYRVVTRYADGEVSPLAFPELVLSVATLI